MSHVAKPRCTENIKQFIIRLDPEKPQEFVDRRCRKKARKDGLCQEHQRVS